MSHKTPSALKKHMEQELEIISQLESSEEEISEEVLHTIMSKKHKLKMILQHHRGGILDLSDTNIAGRHIKVLAEISPTNIYGFDFMNTCIDDNSPAIQELRDKTHVDHIKVTNAHKEALTL